MLADIRLAGVSRHFEWLQQTLEYANLNKIIKNRKFEFPKSGTQPGQKGSLNRQTSVPRCCTAPFPFPFPWNDLLLKHFKLKIAACQHFSFVFFAGLLSSVRFGSGPGQRQSVSTSFKWPVQQAWPMPQAATWLPHRLPSCF